MLQHDNTHTDTEQTINVCNINTLNVKYIWLCNISFDAIYTSSATTFVYILFITSTLPILQVQLPLFTLHLFLYFILLV